MGLAPRFSFDLHPYWMLTHHQGVHYLAPSSHLRFLSWLSQGLSASLKSFLVTCCHLHMAASILWNLSSALTNLHPSSCVASSLRCQVLVVSHLSLVQGFSSLSQIVVSSCADASIIHLVVKPSCGSM